MSRRGRYEWKLNVSGMWAWFSGDRQITGAYRDQGDADYAFEAHRLSDGPPVKSDELLSFKKNPEFERLDRLYGRLTLDQIDAALARMSEDIAAHQYAARREFNGNGGRRTGAALSAQAAREIGQEKILLQMYRDEKGNASPSNIVEANSNPKETV